MPAGKLVKVTAFAAQTVNVDHLEVGPLRTNLPMTSALPFQSHNMYSRRDRFYGMAAGSCRIVQRISRLSKILQSQPEASSPQIALTPRFAHLILIEYKPLWFPN